MPSNETFVCVRGEHWRVVFADLADSDDYGICDDDKKTITIRAGLSRLRTVDIVLHELLHASAFELLSESFVSRQAEDSANALMKLGLLSETNENSLREV
jgi:hypothetical protein